MPIAAIRKQRICWSRYAENSSRISILCGVWDQIQSGPPPKLFHTVASRRDGFIIVALFEIKKEIPDYVRFPRGDSGVGWSRLHRQSCGACSAAFRLDRKSTRLNSSHLGM